jgi:hypothetical protein
MFSEKNKCIWYISLEGLNYALGLSKLLNTT